MAEKNTIGNMTPEQRAAALQKAKETRAARSAVLAKVAGYSKEQFAELLDSNDPVTARIKVSTLLRRFPGVGPKRADAIMQSIGIMPERRIGGLGTKQKAALVESFDDGFKVS